MPEVCDDISVASTAVSIGNLLEWVNDLTADEREEARRVSRVELPNILPRVLFGGGIESAEEGS